MSTPSPLDLIIIGGGPAGVAAGVYAARKRLKTVLVTEEFGGQSVVSEGIENWIGTPKIAGAELAKALKSHVEEYKGDVLSIHEGARATKLTQGGDLFTVEIKDGTKHTARAVLVASGAARRKLTIPGADRLEHKGLTYCASCDGPMFSDMDVVVIGGGNAGFETAAQLLAYAKSVTLIHRHTTFKADAITVEKVLAHPNMRTLTPYEPVEIKGDPFVSSLVVRNKDTGETQELMVPGVFVEVGVIPNTEFTEGLLELDAVKHIVTNPKNQRTSVEGVWAAGDATDELYHQNNIAAGDAVKALEDIYVWLKTR